MDKKAFLLLLALIAVVLFLSPRQQEQVKTSVIKPWAVGFRTIEARSEDIEITEEALTATFRNNAGSTIVITKAGYEIIKPDEAVCLTVVLDPPTNTTILENASFRLKVKDCIGLRSKQNYIIQLKITYSTPEGNVTEEGRITGVVD